MDAHTSLAIQEFEKICRLERQLAKANQRLNAHAARIPDQDRAEYVQVTTQLEKQYGSA
jgi:hypothetical protein